MGESASAPAEPGAGCLKCPYLGTTAWINVSAFGDEQRERKQTAAEGSTIER